MNRIILTSLSGAALLYSGLSSADVIASLSFTNPTGTVTADETIAVWVTLSLDASSEPLTYQEGEDQGGLPASLIPTVAEVWNDTTHEYDYIAFATYEYVGHTIFRTCTGTFTNGCGAGEYTAGAVTSGGDSWFDTNFLNLQAGDSQDFLIYEFSPTDGSATPDDYILYNAGIGFVVHGQDVNGNPIEQDIVFSTCTGGDPSCAFTRTVSAVPVPAAVWLFGSGLIGLVGMARRRKLR